MNIIDEASLNKVIVEAKVSPRLRMNYNLHKSLDDKCHRLLNAVEPGTTVPIHRHPTKDESFVVLKGRVKIMTYTDEGKVLEEVILDPKERRYGVDKMPVDARAGSQRTLESFAKN